MKIIFLLSLAFMSLRSQAQATHPSHSDTCLHKQQLLTTDQRLDNIQLNLLKFGRQYNAGTMLVLAGITTTLLSSWIASTKYKEGNPYTLVPSYIGAGITIIGAVIQIDSHKLLRRAGGYYQSNF